MQFRRFQELCEQGAGCVGVAVGEPEIEGLYRYFQELRRWGAKTNLVSREMGDEELVDKHFIDSLALLSLLGGQSGPLLDVGSGAGFPGLVCKITQPGRKVSLLEPRLKRVSFLRHIIRTLGLGDIEVLPSRLEDRQELVNPLQYHWVVSRAVTSVGDFLGWCSRFARPDCRVVCMKGPRFEEELAAVATLSVPWTQVDCRQYRLPGSGAARVLLVFQGGVTKR